MLTKYFILYTNSRLKITALAGILGRIGYEMVTLGMVTMLSRDYHSYIIATIVTACYTFSFAGIFPIISKLLDKYGERKIVPTATTIAALALISLTWASYKHAPLWVLILITIAISLNPSLPNIIRVRWTHIHSDTQKLTTAFAIEAIFDEICYIIGPALAIFLNTKYWNQTALIISAILLGVGGYLLTFTQPTTSKNNNQLLTNPKTLSLKPKLKKIFIIISPVFFIGSIAAPLEISSLVIANNIGKPNLASLPIFFGAVAAATSGFIFGTKAFIQKLEKLYMICLFLHGIVLLPFWKINNMVGVALITILLGALYSPTMIIANKIMLNLVNPQQATQGLSWITSSQKIGITASSILAGILIDNYSVTAALTTLAGIGIILIFISIIGYKNYLK